ncbi:MAG: nucleotide exchange factor GrpE [Actinobacteria bacterium]|nr:MAG: nucleotide exchange factor GrpE [Actinomycetota bacterium]
MSQGGEPPEGGKPTDVPQPVPRDDRRGPEPVDPEEGPGDPTRSGAEPSSGPDSREGREAGEPSEMREADEQVNGSEAIAEDASLVAVATQRDEYLDALRRVQAEFENYKKRVLRQQTEHLERAAEGIVVKLLPVLDSLDLALSHAGDSPEAKVVAPIAASLFDVLSKEGLERIDPQGQPFDPNQHDAVMHEEGDEEPEVSDVLRAGYRWKGRVLRPAMVKVKG